MKRVNIYITKPQEDNIASIADVLNVTRAEVVRRAVIEFTENHQKEINKFIETFNENDNIEQTFLRECAKSPKFFIKNAIKINSNHYFDMGNLQSDLIDILHKHNEVIVNKSRRCGATITHLAYMLYYAIFNPNKNIIIFSHRLHAANQLLETFKYLLISLPKFMQPKIIRNNNHSIELDNGTKIMDANYTHGMYVHYLYMDEIAMCNPNTLKEFINDFHPVSTSQEENTKRVISSNPNGFNEFYHLWSGALTGYNNLKPVCIPWQAVPGRDEKWKEEQIKCIGERAFKQEFECKFIGNNMLFPGLKEAPMMSF